MDVKFTDNSMRICAEIERAITAGLHEAGGEFLAQVQRNSRVDTGDTKASFDYKVIGDTVYVGSNEENAIWEEFGTGTHAETGGRAGYWVFVKGSGGGGRSNGKRYTLQEAKQIMAILRKKGLEAYYTNGKKGTRALRNGMESKAPVAVKLIERKLRSIQ